MLFSIVWRSQTQGPFRSGFATLRKNAPHHCARMLRASVLCYKSSSIAPDFTASCLHAVCSCCFCETPLEIQAVTLLLLATIYVEICGDVDWLVLPSVCPSIALIIQGMQLHCGAFYFSWHERKDNFRSETFCRLKFGRRIFLPIKY